MTATSIPAGAKLGKRHGRAMWGEYAFQAVAGMALLIALIILLILIVDVTVKAMPVITQRSWDFLSSDLASRPKRAGIWQGIVGSFQLAAIVAITAFPIGVATAIYLEEYAPPTRLTRFIDINIRNLAGVPSVVYGLLGLAIFVELLGPGGVANLTGGKSVITGGLTLAALALPIVIITSAEAIRGVPGTLREAGFGLGATRSQTLRQLILPAAMPGILTGVILALSRAIGETAPLIVVGAVLGTFGSGSLSVMEKLTGSYTALPVVIYDWARKPGEFQQVLSPAAIIVLLLFTLSANAAAIWLRNRFERRAAG